MTAEGGLNTALPGDTILLPEGGQDGTSETTTGTQATVGWPGFVPGPPDVLRTPLEQ